MKLLAGTSGFSYKEWKGRFYPEKLPAKQMLGYYASRLPIVEINNTFYRLPNQAVIEEWRGQVPATFRFAVKASRRITHIKRLAEAADDFRFFLERVAGLQPAIGSILLQLPPFQRKDVARLAAFVAAIPDGTRAAFEFRHDSWFDDAVYAVLTERNLALVLSETDEYSPASLPWTADWAYLRLRKTQYSDAELAAWHERLTGAKLEEAQIFFKHEDEATGPRLAEGFLSRYAAASSS